MRMEHIWPGVCVCLQSRIENRQMPKEIEKYQVDVDYDYDDDDDGDVENEKGHQ